MTKTMCQKVPIPTYNRGEEAFILGGPEAPILM